ncbi:HlyD family secretion protein [Methylomarinovum caldicuralii]|uniref:HlyD family secretion protein n=1 Tax=Methylomarinovum caldicuralii TaxID=438856 RepID=A0AAU9BSH9_9GAMM|nr:efflux RND transporter periplasmic adaptor subunit [Methylomarinovum caldicuralii]BCX81828.1 HlyD family secretion protein [Methylomarinovum caldicuralii]
MTARSRRFAILVFGLALFLLALWYGRRPQPIPVRVYRVAPGLVEETVANTRVGSVKACRRSQLSPNLGGQIAELYVREGDRVKAGQLLLRLWNRDLEANLQLASAQWRSAQAEAAAACLQAQQARRDADRLRRLGKRHLAAEQTVEQAVFRARSHTRKCDAARATVEVRQAQVAAARAQLEKTELRAPFAGVVAEIHGEVGEYLTPSPPGVATPPAVDLIATGCFYITAPIDEIDSGRLRPGLETRIHIDAFGERRFPGRLRRIAPYVLAVEKQARTVEVEADFLHPEDAALQRPGYSADVEIVLARRDGVLRIPTEAVMEGGKVLVLDPDSGRLVQREVTIGLSNWDWSEVRSGLEAGEQVVLSLDREGVEPGAYAVAEERQ